MLKFIVETLLIAVIISFVALFIFGTVILAFNIHELLGLAYLVALMICTLMKL